MKKISEVEQYIKKQKILFEQQSNKNFVAQGFTREGIEIKIIKNKENKLITAYPIM